MSKRRIQFSKTGMGKYISHLDLLRTFTRTIKRSGLPVRYSQGFNPHQLITFSLPLPVGVTSICEYVDIDFEDTVSDAEIMEGFNQNLPMDMRALSVGDLFHKASTICGADYRIELLTAEKIEENWMRVFFDAEAVMVEKKTKKKGMVSVNLMEYIMEHHYRGQDEQGGILDVRLSAGGEKNLKPELLTAALAAALSRRGVEMEGVNIERRQIYCMADGELIPFC